MTILLEVSGAKIGYLFGVVDGKPRFLAASPAAEVPADLEQVLQQRLLDYAAYDDGDTVTVRQDRVTDSSFTGFNTADGQLFEMLLLSTGRLSDPPISATAVVNYGDESPPPPSPALLETLARAIAVDYH